MPDSKRKIQEFLDNLTHAQLIDRLALALAGGGLGIWDWDLRDNSVQFDARWCEMLGLVHAETPMVLQTWSERVHPEDMAACLADIQAHLDGKTARYENIHRLRHANGEWRYILDRGRISGRDEEGKPIRFTGTHFDVTTTEQARRVLAHQEQILHQLVENLPSGVAMLDRQYRVVALSPRWRQDLGLSPDDLLGRSFQDLVSDPQGLWEAAFQRALSGIPTQGEDTRIGVEKGDGTVIRWQVHPWHQSDGSLGGILHMTEDITEAVLQKKAAERDREARLAALSVFAGGVAHELNTPLQVILTELEVLEELLAEENPDPAALRAGLGSLVSTTRRAAAVSRGLRTLSREDHRDYPVPLRVGNLFRDAEALCGTRVESSGNFLRFSDQSVNSQILCHPASLLHALLESIAFANEHTQPGGTIRVTAEREGGILHITLSHPGHPPINLRDGTEWRKLLLRDSRLRLIESLLQRNTSTLVWVAGEDCTWWKIAVACETDA